MNITIEQFNQLVTKDYLEDRFQFLITKDYLEERLQFNQLMTKDYLELRLDVFKKDLKTELKEELASKTQVNELMTAVLAIAKQFQDFRAELSAFYSLFQRHDRRFTKIGGILKIDYQDVDDMI